MKPTLHMRRAGATAIPAAAPRPEQPSAPAAPSLIEDLVARKGKYVEALKQTRELRDSGRIAKAVAERLARLSGSATERPEAGPEGTLVARVVGIAGDKQRLPLPGLDVQLKFGQEIVSEDKTDFTGLVVLALPKEQREGKYEIDIIGSDCQVCSCARGALRAGDRPTHLIEVEPKEGLKPAFQRGEVWLHAGKAATERADQLTRAVEKALAAQERELEKGIRELDDAMTRLRPTGGDIR
jgi:hypothetical protein